MSVDMKIPFLEGHAQEMIRLARSAPEYAHRKTPRAAVQATAFFKKLRRLWHRMLQTYEAVFAAVRFQEYMENAIP